MIDARGGGLSPRGGLSMGRGVTIPGGLGITGLIVFLLIQVLSGGGGSAGAYSVDNPFGAAPQAPAADGQGIPAAQDPERDLKDFSAYVFSNALDTWSRLFREEGRSFERAKVVFYRDAVATGCGDASSGVGPFYCPADRRVYLDLSFYGDMESKLGAPGDFAWAYVIAHEVGHHVQEQLGTSDEVAGLQRQEPGEAKALSVRLELQADCFAGVWGNHAKQERDFLESGDIEEALGAASAIGDDRLQRQTRGMVVPESFTHGSSAQRMAWFRRGLESGDPQACDTFSGG